MKKKDQTEKFCHSILGMSYGKSKLLSNAVMALSSGDGSGSVTGLSESSSFHYQFSSMSKLLEDMGGMIEDEDRQELYDQYQSESWGIRQEYWPEASLGFHLLNTDTTPLIRLYSPTLSRRRYIYYAPSLVGGNKPISVGYELSVIGLSARRPHYGLSEPAWNLPLSMELVDGSENLNLFTAHQVNDLLNRPELPLGQELSLNALDSKYAHPEYIVNTADQPHLVNVIRLASNRNVWVQLSPEEQAQRRAQNPTRKGATAIYGSVYKLSQSQQWDRPCDRSEELCIQGSNGKNQLLQIDIWEGMLLRTKRGWNMKDKPFRLVRIQLFDPLSGESRFKRPLWLGVWGKRKDQLQPWQIFWAYRLRFDIEHFFRFGKQRLLLDRFQTPDLPNWRAWFEIQIWAYWLLWAAKQEAQYQVPKWRKYEPNFQKRATLGLPASPSEVQNQLQTIIWGFDQRPFRPKLKIKGKGRIKGTTLTKRKRYPIWKKQKNTSKTTARAP